MVRAKGRRLGQDHDHSDGGRGGDAIEPELAKISRADIEKLIGALDADGQDLTNVGNFGAQSVDTDVTNNVYWVPQDATVADIDAIQQQALDDSQYGDDAAVAFEAGGTIEIAGEITVRDGVTLFCNGSRIVQTADDNVLFLQTNAHVVGPLDIRCQAVDPFSSDAVVYDTSRTADRYANTVKTHSTITGPVYLTGDTGEGNGLALRTDGTGNTIGPGNDIGPLFINGFKNGILGDSKNGAWNGGYTIRATIQDATNLVNQTGSKAFYPLLKGVLQSNANTDYGVRNQVTGEGSVRFVGYLFDSGNFNTAAWDGDGMVIDAYNQLQFSHGNAGDGVRICEYFDQRGTTGTPTVSVINPPPGSKVLNDDGVWFLDPTLTWNGPV